ncbi:MAG TPA: tail fiber domain-containing protein [Thermoanaerobaculia bacterium]|nr:tail fiber domain-containing protein [Thermoanaerobaculia bacterium]
MLTIHDEKNGAIVNTSGDLSFRLGKFFQGKDEERMRLTAEGNLGIGTDKPQAKLDVNGMIRASEGIMFSDGTILRTSDGEVVIEKAGANPSGRRTIVETVVRSQPTSIPRRLKPSPTVSPDFQFKVDATGVHIGTTPTFGLDVAGDATLSSNLALPVTNVGGTAGVITFGFGRFLYTFGGNTFLGPSVGNFTMTGTSNTASGASALSSNMDGSDNTVSGVSALLNNTSGSGNTAMGKIALRLNTAGFQNTAIGSGALETNTMGNNNTAIGIDALDATTGSNNIGIGALGGLSLTTGDNNIDIGNQGAPAEANTIRVGAAQTRTFIAGIRGKTTGAQDAVNVMIDSNGQLGTISSSRRFKFDIEDMGDVTGGLMRLRPVTFRYLKYGNDAAIQYGLIAEDVADVYPEMVARDKDGNVDTVMYQFLAPMMLNEVQRQHREIEEQRKTIDTLNATLDKLERRLQALETRSN